MRVFLEGGATSLAIPGAMPLDGGPAAAPVVSAETAVVATPALLDAIARTVAEFPDGDHRYEFLDVAGRQIGLHVRRGPANLSSDTWVPVVVPGDAYLAEAHRSEAEAYRDRIGDRLLRPETVDETKKHLIVDDRQRADRVLALRHRSPLLDVGCSDGTLLFEAVRRWDVADAVGIDVAASALEEGRRVLAADPELARRVRLVESFIETLDFPDGYFATITACETLEHVGQGQLDAALRNLLRMLGPGGDMIVTVPNRFPAPEYETRGRARWSWPAHHQFYTKASLSRLLAPHFHALEWLTHHEGDSPGNGIYLIARAAGRR